MECFNIEVAKSSFSIPQPLSRTQISSIPPFFNEITISVDSASIELSISSLIMEAGLSITSPAAIFE